MVKLSELSAGSYWQTTGMRLGTGNPPEVILDVSEPVKQAYGKIHGGAVAGLIDSAIAVAVNTKIGPEKGAYTIEIKVNFLLPVDGGSLYAQGEIVSKGNNILVGECKVRNDEGEIVAIGIGTFKVFQR